MPSVARVFSVPFSLSGVLGPGWERVVDLAVVGPGEGVVCLLVLGRRYHEGAVTVRLSLSPPLIFQALME